MQGKAEGKVMLVDVDGLIQFAGQARALVCIHGLDTGTTVFNSSNSAMFEVSEGSHNSYVIIVALGI